MRNTSVAFIALSYAVTITACSSSSDSSNSGSGGATGTGAGSGAAETGTGATGVGGGSSPGAICGNGVVEAGETCDPCPAGCDDANACSLDQPAGSAQTCNLTCSRTFIDTCINGDGCCPAACTSANDSDCSATCGNSVLDANETCDPPANCPTTCDDGNACTVDQPIGSAQNCNASCGHTDITQCAAGDGCCPSGCDSTNDGDCSAVGTGGAGTGGGSTTGTGGSTDGTGGDTGVGGTAASGGESTGGEGTGTGGVTVVLPELVTSSSQAYWVTTGTLTEVAAGNADVTVNENSTAQTWEGFGGSFNEMGWHYLLMLSEADRNAALELLFGVDGCRFALGRIPMGSSDYGMDRYTLDEVPAGETDLTMSQFSADRDLELLIPFIKAAQAVRSDIFFWSSPWTPPTWMKEGPFNTDSPFDGGSMKTDPDTLSAHAQYFVKFVQAYADQGIDIKVVAPQNEPGYSGTYPTCAWTANAYRDFVGLHLGPALADAGLNVGIMVGTFNGGTVNGTADTAIVSTVMGDATASGYVTALGYQWGMSGNVGSAQQYGVPVWQTEHMCGNYPWQTYNDQFAPNDHAYAVESWGLIRDWIRAGVTTYSSWNMVLDTVGVGIDFARVWPQNALLTVDTTENRLNITPTYYVFRHFSQFVEPGAQVLGTTGGDAMAFRNPDGTIITVMYNSGGASTYTLSVGGTMVQFDIPGDGWATVVH